MPRFYFNSLSPAGRLNDEEGVEFDTAEEAMEDAHKAALELGGRDVAQLVDIAGRAIEVCDESGKVVGVAPLTGAVEQKL